MLSKIKSYWNYGNNFCSIELTTVSGENALFSVTAKKKENEFTSFEFQKASSFSELSKALSKNQHCFLIVNTRKVLIKEIPFEENNQKVIAQAFPSLSLNDFYYEILKTKTKCFVAICRKEDVDVILKEATDQNIEVLGFELGFSSLSKITPLVSETNIITARQNFTTQEGEINSFSEHKENHSVSYTIEDTSVDANFLIALSGIFQYLPFSKKQIANFIEENKNLQTQQNQKTFFRKGLLTAVGILLFSLLINFFLFNTYYKQQQVKFEELELLKSQNKNYLSKSSAIKDKERIVQNILNSGNSKSSFYINRIVAYKPSSILFDEIIFQPLEKAIRADKPIEYNYGGIAISGQSNEKTSFSNWIETLENFNWVKSVTVTSYGYSKKNVSSFSVNLIIKTDAIEK